MINTKILSLWSCRLLLTALCLFLVGACAPSGHMQIRREKAERRPLTRVPVKLEVPANYQLSETEDGKPRNHKPRVVVVDERSGRYEFRWIGYDGKEKIIKYQRLGAIDITVFSRVEKEKDGRFLYTYTVENLENSPNDLTGFTVQTLASDALPVDPESSVMPGLRRTMIGDMFNQIKGFSEGTWWRFSIREPYHHEYGPQTKTEYQVRSSAMPGVVGCKADGGIFGMIGAGEDLPPELERLSLGTKDWPYGYTVGPDDRLSGFTQSERAKYLIDNLGKFQEAGWMMADTSGLYREFLVREDIKSLFEQAKIDLDNEFITPEVYIIIAGVVS